jgi:hypothetical protein
MSDFIHFGTSRLDISAEMLHAVMDAAGSLNPMGAIALSTFASIILRSFAMRHINQNTDKNARFEYEVLPAEQRVVIQQLTREIRADLRYIIAIVWQIGGKLAVVRSQIKPWQFTAWLKAEFDWSRSTAYNFISVYRSFPDLSRPNFGRLDIPLSALYLLAAPSTPPEIRSHFLDLALAGVRISRKAVREFIQASKAIPINRDDGLPRSELLPTQDVCVHPIPIESGGADTCVCVNVAAAVLLSDSSDVEGVELASELADDDSIASDLHPAWNSIDPDFSLFWGDTNSPHQTNRLPADGLVLAVPSRQWHHEWLLKESRSCITIVEPKLEPEIVTGLLSVISAGGKSLIFPWLPSWKMVELALNLNLRIYAGDPNLDRCEQTIANLGFDLWNIDRIRW